MFKNFVCRCLSLNFVLLNYWVQLKIVHGGQILGKYDCLQTAMVYNTAENVIY